MKKQTIFDILAIIFISILCISISPITLQNDTYYTIAIGEHIIENGGIDMMDPFSWHEGLEYTYPHWLYDVIIYSIYNIGGMLGIYISTCIFTIMLGVLIYKVNSKLAKNKVISFFITIGAIYMLRSYITARAQLVTFILFIIQIFFIEKLLSTKQKKYGLGLVTISILITNLHVAVWPFMFVLYLPYIAEYVVAIFEERHAKRHQQELKDGYKIAIQKPNNMKYLIIVMLICVLTGLLTPLGPTTPYTYLYKTMQGNTTQNINEHLPMTLITNLDALCVMIIFIAILAFTNSKIRLSDLFMLGGLALLMLYSKRQLSIFIIVGSIILNRVLFNWIEMYIQNVDEKLIKAFTAKMGIFLLFIFVLTLSINFVMPKLADNYIDESAYPVQMSDFILEYFETNNINIEDVRLYNEYNYGSYLLYRGIPVFIDSRCDLYAPEYNGGQDIFMDFIESSSLSIWFEDTFEKYGITHIILYKDSKMNLIIKDGQLDGYNLIKEDDYFVFYEVNLPEGK